MKPPGAVPLNSFTLSFKEPYSFLEGKFLTEYFPGSLKRVRLVLIFGILTYDLFGILDAVIVPDQKKLFWILRYLVFTPAAVSVYFLTYAGFFRKIIQYIYVLMEVFAGGLIIVMIIVSDSPAKSYYYAGLILVFMMAYTSMDMRFLWATITGWFIVVMYEIAAVYFAELNTPIFINNNFFFVGANIIGMFAG